MLNKENLGMVKVKLSDKNLLKWDKKVAEKQRFVLENIKEFLKKSDNPDEVIKIFSDIYKLARSQDSCNVIGGPDEIWMERLKLLKETADVLQIDDIGNCELKWLSSKDS